VQVKIQFGVHIRGFTQFLLKTEKASVYTDWENTGTVDLELYEVRNEPSMNTIYISLKQQTVMSWLYFTKHTDVIIKQDKVIWIADHT
jgi:hypothetical protein